MFDRLSWGALLAALLTVLTLVAAALDEQTLTIGLGLCAVTWAILSLKERT